MIRLKIREFWLKRIEFPLGEEVLDSVTGFPLGRYGFGSVLGDVLELVTRPFSHILARLLERDNTAGRVGRGRRIIVMTNRCLRFYESSYWTSAPTVLIALVELEQIDSLDLDMGATTDRLTFSFTDGSHFRYHLRELRPDKFVRSYRALL